MQIKRFEAGDMTSALRLIKNELGPDAVILSARSLKKENKLLGLVNRWAWRLPPRSTPIIFRLNQMEPLLPGP